MTMEFEGAEFEGVASGLIVSAALLWIVMPVASFAMLAQFPGLAV